MKRIFYIFSLISLVIFTGCINNEENYSTKKINTTTKSFSQKETVEYLTNSVTINNIKLNKNEWRFFGPFLSGDDGIKVLLQGEGDADLYLQEDKKPSKKHFLCRPYDNSSEETCISKISGTYYIGVLGYSQNSEVSIQILSNPIEQVKIDKKWSKYDIVTRSNMNYYGPFLIKKGFLAITMSGPADADLYAKKGSIPSMDSFDCRPFYESSFEQCFFKEDGIYFVAVRGADDINSPEQTEYKISFHHTGDAFVTRYYLKDSFTIYKNQWRNIGKISVLENPVTVLMTGPPDADLYTHQKSKPQLEKYDCRPYFQSSNEKCTLKNIGDHFISVYGFSEQTATSVELFFSSNFPLSKSKLNILGTENIETIISMTNSYNGEYYILGSTNGKISNETPNGGKDLFIVKYSIYGDIKWIKQLGTNKNDYPVSITFSEEQIIIAGHTEGVFEGNVSSGGNMDLFIITLNSDGGILNTVQLGDDDEILKTMQLKNGVLYFFGEARGGDFSELFLSAYTEKSEEIWTQFFSSPLPSDLIFANDMFVTDSTIFLTGTILYGENPEYIFKTDLLGNKIDSIQTGGKKIRITNSRIIFLDKKDSLITINQSGDILFSLIGPFITFEIDSKGNIYTLTKDGIDCKITVYDSFGNKLGIKKWHGECGKILMIDESMNALRVGGETKNNIFIKTIELTE